MTKENYSIQGLNSLLNDLGKLSTCVMTIPQERIDKKTYNKLREDQDELIQKIICYGNVLERTKE